MNLFIDRQHRLPRIWSNRELKKFAHFFHGDVVNVSAWEDIDKEDKQYRDYFINARSYVITNYKNQFRSFQGYEGEIFLDLECELPEDLINKFDVVFNHTVLEHIYNVRTAFKNLCLMSKDIVILIVPFLQEMHSDFGDYWRFSPLAVKKMFEENNMFSLYLNFNRNKNSSVYVFSIATKNKSKWEGKIHSEFTYSENSKPLGHQAINNLAYQLSRKIKRLKGYIIGKKYEK